MSVIPSRGTILASGVSLDHTVEAVILFLTHLMQLVVDGNSLRASIAAPHEQAGQAFSRDSERDEGFPRAEYAGGPTRVGQG